jgi:hypothetical protein
MFSATFIRTRVVATVGAVAIAAVLAACSASPGAAPSQPPAMPAPDSPAPATPAPATPAPATPAPTPSQGAEDPGSDAMPIHVELDSTSGQDVYVDIVDRTGTIERAVTGRPGEGVSVGSDTINVENLDARTLRLTWSDFPIDNGLSLFVDPVGTGYRFLMIQPAPTGPADAMGEDRILELAFDHEVSAAEVEAFIQEGLDVPG